MKKIAQFLLVFIFVACLAGCGAKLPKGEATKIVLVEGSTIFYSVSFEYVNETTVKIIDGLGQVSYVPASNIAIIRVK